MRLLLFDIDGTLLLRASAEHRDAVHDALRAVWGLRAPEAVPVEAAGRTDLDIAREILLLSGVRAEEIDDGLRAFRAAVTESYALRCPDDLSAHVAPGMADVLAALHERGDCVLSLVTGNLEPVARLKLERAGLGRWFARGEGAFGSDSEDRAALPPLARRRAGARAGLGGAWPRASTVVIGDTPRDIACARADGVDVVAVTTGPFAASALAGADAVAATARDLLGVL